MNSVNYSTILQASQWLADFRHRVEKRSNSWYPPHITSDEGDIVFEWARGVHRLTIFIGSEGADPVFSEAHKKLK